ncbi:MAG TPA: hypothetical protein VGD58_16845 [Herpetosiphonaceae bacterium]
MPAKKRVQAGDIIAIPFGEQQVAVAIVLHLSKEIVNGIMVGIYDRCYGSIDEIRVEDLGGDFIDVPNYTGKQMVRDGDWPVIGHRADLLAATPIPELRSANILYHKDTVVRMLSREEERNYPVQGGAGMGYVENQLRKHFAQR